jgi:hypothetical protein
MTASTANCRNIMLLIPLIEEAAVFPVLRECPIFPWQCELFLVSSSVSSVNLGNVVMLRG